MLATTVQRYFICPSYSTRHSEQNSSHYQQRHLAVAGLTDLGKELSGSSLRSWLRQPAFLLPKLQLPGLRWTPRGKEFAENIYKQMILVVIG